jgi:hypothetical protein
LFFSTEWPIIWKNGALIATNCDTTTTPSINVASVSDCFAEFVLIFALNATPAKNGWWVRAPRFETGPRKCIGAFAGPGIGSNVIDLHLVIIHLVKRRPPRNSVANATTKKLPGCRIE